jgi:hypothetical protein
MLQGNVTLRCRLHRKSLLVKWKRKKGSKLRSSLYAAFYGDSMAQLWPLQNWLYQTERQKHPKYTAAIAEAEGA